MVQNSWGDNGIHGRHLFTREVINQAVERYGAFMFSDIPKEKQQWYMENGISSEDNWASAIIKAIWVAIIRLFNKREYAKTH